MGLNRDGIYIKNKNLGNYLIPSGCRTNVCVDIGSNIGDFLMSVVDIFDDVYFFESYIENYNICANKTKNHSNVKGFNKAVYSHDDNELNIKIHHNRECGSLAVDNGCLNDEWLEGSVHSSKTISLESILELVGGHINYLKSDCETSEYPFLMNKDLSNIDYIGIELHHQMGKKKFDELVEYICKTHTPNKNIYWVRGKNVEILFTNKKI